MQRSKIMLPYLCTILPARHQDLVLPAAWFTMRVGRVRRGTSSIQGGGVREERRRRRKTTLTCLSLSALDNHTHTHTYPPRNLNPLKRRQQARESWRHALQVQHRYNPRSNSYLLFFLFRLIFTLYKDLSPVFFSLWLLSYRAPAGGFHTTLACR